MSDAALPDPTALDKGRDDKALADAFKVWADVISKLAALPAMSGAAPPPPVPPPPPVAPPAPGGSSAPTPAQISFARAALAAAFTGLPQVLLKATAHLGAGAGSQAGKATATAIHTTANTVSAVGKMVAARFAAALGPLAVFAQTLQASNSGMNVLSKGMQVLGATLAPIVLPAAVALTAGLVELADQIGADGEFQKNLSDWTRVIIGMTPHLLELARATASAASAMSAFLGAPKGVGDAYDAIRDKRDRMHAQDALARGLDRDRYARQLGGEDIAVRVRRLTAFDEEIKRNALKDAIDTSDLTADRHRANVTASPEYQRLMAGDPAKAAALLKEETDRFQAVLTELRQTEPGRIGPSNRIKVPLPRDLSDPTEPKTLQERNAAAARAAGKTREQFEQSLREAAAKQGVPKFAVEDLLKKNLEAFDRLKAAPPTAATPEAKPEVPAATPGAAPGTSAPKTGGPAKPAPRLPLKSVLDDVVQSLKLSILPQASIGSLEGVGRQVQLKALQSDPLEQRLLDITTKSVDRLDSIIGELKGLRGDMTTPAKKGPGGPTFTTDGSKPK